MKKFFVIAASLICGCVSGFSQSYTSDLESLLKSLKTETVGTKIDLSGGINTDVVFQQGYTKSNGTFVEGHYKTKSNNTNWDNFSTHGNVNPFTGSIGSIARDYSVDAYNYGAGNIIHTGPRGGQYYINSNGNKTYVPKRSQNIFGW